MRVQDEDIRECPKCDAVTLEKKLYSLGSGVIMDCCPKCQGVWLDRGELEKIRAALYSEPARPRVVARQPVPQHIIVNFEVMQQVHDLQARPRA